MAAVEQHVHPRIGVVVWQGDGAAVGQVGIAASEVFFDELFLPRHGFEAAGPRVVPVVVAGNHDDAPGEIFDGIELGTQAAFVRNLQVIEGAARGDAMTAAQGWAKGIDGVRQLQNSLSVRHRHNTELIEEHLLSSGALLFRGFSVSSVPEFEQFVQAVCPNMYGEYGDLPKEDQGEKIYHSTPYPADKVILFHNESSHMSRWPRKQFASRTADVPSRA